MTLNVTFQNTLLAITHVPILIMIKHTYFLLLNFFKIFTIHMSVDTYRQVDCWHINPFILSFRICRFLLKLFPLYFYSGGFLHPCTHQYLLYPLNTIAASKKRLCSSISPVIHANMAVFWFRLMNTRIVWCQLYSIFLLPFTNDCFRVCLPPALCLSQGCDCVERSWSQCSSLTVATRLQSVVSLGKYIITMPLTRVNTS